MGGDLELFELKRAKGEYISNMLFESIKDSVPNDFDLELHNSRFLKAKRQEYKEYFDHILDEVDENITLDDEQRDAIIAEEDRSLIIAGAGTGKTTTMTAKVKYLTDKLNIDPKEILVMSYSRRDVQELRNRINIDLNIPADVTTFHSLGFRYIRSIFEGRKCFVVDENLRNKIFVDFLRTNIYQSREALEDFMSCFNKDTTDINLYSNFLEENFRNYPNFDSYFVAYKNHRKAEAKDIDQIIKNRISFDINSETPRTLRGERVKSKGEARIANWLLCHKIDYEYEELFDEIMPDANTYKPDFTINAAGTTFYVEFFGLSGPSEEPSAREYERIRKLKEKYHEANKNNFISLEYNKNVDYLDVLKDQLERKGVNVNNELTQDEVYDIILDRNPLAEFYKVCSFFYKLVDAVKEYDRRDEIDNIVTDELNKVNPEKRDILKRQYTYFRSFYLFYGKAIHRSEDMLGFDFSDMIYYAKNYIDTLSEKHFNYKYIIVDEYQDISPSRYALANATLGRSGAKLMAVGDDWQTIYSFAGSRIEYTYNFKNYFKGAKLFKITKTYRNPQSLINIAGDFIMKNPDQIKKDLRSNKDLANPFIFIDFEGKPYKEALRDEYTHLRKAIIQIHTQLPDHSILVLSRKNYDIKQMFELSDGHFRKRIDTKVELTDCPGFLFDAMSIHKSKGLTADWTFIIGLDNEFPSGDRASFWIERLFRDKPIEERISYAEERRIFYVALTRTKRRVILFRNKNSKKRSKFVDELYDMVRRDSEDRYR